MGLVDSHCHLDLIEERNLSLHDVFSQCIESEVNSILQIATDLPSSRWNKSLVHKYKEDSLPKLYWSAGLHPENAQDLSSQDDLFNLIRESRDEPNFWGIGETGLDYFHTTEFIDNQKKSFIAHMELADELRLPVVIHTRDDKSYNPDKTGSVCDVLGICKNFPNVKGVLHCFTYTDIEAKGFIDLGWYVSYSGVLTFNNAKAVQKGALSLPLEQILVETDAPFLAPAPHRGKTNQPSFVKHTLDFLIELRSKNNNEEPSEIRNAIYKNSLDFLNLKNTMK